MRMSKSSVDSYIRCPYNFFLNKIKGRRNLHPEPIEGSPLKKGTELHQIFEDFYDMPEAEALTSEKDILHMLDGHPLSKKAHLELVDPTHENLYNKYSNYEDLENEYHKHLVNFASFNSLVMQEKGYGNYVPEYLELELYNKEKNFLGYIDRAEKLPDGTYRILDYKTGVSKPLKNYLVELGLYKWLFEAEMGKPVSEVGIFFSVNGHLRTTQLTQAHVQHALDVLDIVNFLISIRVYPKHKNNFMCKKFCENYVICQKTPYINEINNEIPEEYYELVR